MIIDIFGRHIFFFLLKCFLNRTQTVLSLIKQIGNFYIGVLVNFFATNGILFMYLFVLKFEVFFDILN